MTPARHLLQREALAANRYEASFRELERAFDAASPAEAVARIAQPRWGMKTAGRPSGMRAPNCFRRRMEAAELFSRFAV
jgi:hypothetical protein